MKKKNTTAILAFFFGALGVHRFYLGKRFQALLYIGITIFSFILTIEEHAPFIFFAGIIPLIDTILFFAMPKEEFDVKYNQVRYAPTYADRTPPVQRPQRRPNRFAAAPAAPVGAAPVAKARKKVDNPFKKSGIAKYREYDYEGAIADFQKALRFKYEEPAVHFNLSCCYSINEDLDQSLFHLHKAVQFGFVQLDRIHDHPALSFIRTHDEFEEFVKKGYQIVNLKEDKIPTPSIPTENNEPSNVDMNTPLPDLLDQIKRLGELKEKGVLTNEEFEMQKQKILGENA